MKTVCGKHQQAYEAGAACPYCDTPRQAYLEYATGGYREGDYDVLLVSYRLNVNGPGQPVAVPRAFIDKDPEPERYDPTGEPETWMDALRLAWDRLAQE